MLDQRLGFSQSLLAAGTPEMSERRGQPQLQPAHLPVQFSLQFVQRRPGRHVQQPVESLHGLVQRVRRPGRPGGQSPLAQSAGRNLPDGARLGTAANDGQDGQQQRWEPPAGQIASFARAFQTPRLVEILIRQGQRLDFSTSAEFIDDAEVVDGRLVFELARPELPRRRLAPPSLRPAVPLAVDRNRPADGSPPPPSPPPPSSQ